MRTALGRCAVFALLLSSTFLGCSCEPKPKPCDCVRADSDTWLYEAQQDSLLEEMVASGEVSTDSREYKFLKKRIAADKKSAYEYFGDRWRDVGYKPGEFHVEPEIPSQKCETTFVWRSCFEGRECRWPGELETGPFKEVLWVRPAPGSVDVEPFLVTAVLDTISRESLVVGDCAEYRYTYPGLFPAGSWEATIKVIEVTNEDCKGKTDRNVAANDSLVIQFEVGCACDDHERYDVSMLTPPFLDHPNNNLQWNLQFPWAACGDHPAEFKTIHEKMQIERVRDGVVVDGWEDATFEMLMGSTTGRSYPLDSPKLEPGESYLLTVEISGADCGCSDEDLLLNNRQTLTFSL